MDVENYALLPHKQLPNHINSGRRMNVLTVSENQKQSGQYSHETDKRFRRHSTPPQNGLDRTIVRSHHLCTLLPSDVGVIYLREREVWDLFLRRRHLDIKAMARSSASRKARSLP